MAVVKKNIRDLLAGKELIGFKKSSVDGERAVERASSAKVTVIKAPRKPASPEQA
jgi:hypothetical protein